MLTSPRVIVIDDNRGHLDGLVEALHSHGVACLPIHFPDDLSRLKACPNLRVLFADLNLLDSGPGHETQFNHIASLIDGTLKPYGPYLIVLWTAYPHQANALYQLLKKRVKDSTIPVKIVPLDKAKYLSESDEVDGDRLLCDLAGLEGQSATLSALFDWEEQIMTSAGSTVSSMLDIAEEPGWDMAGLIRTMAVEAVGSGNVDADRFRAVNEALLPVLFDRVSALRAQGDTTRKWNQVFKEASASSGNVPSVVQARLNRMFHIDQQVFAGGGVERGAVIPLNFCMSVEDFKNRFGLNECVVAQEQFGCTCFEQSCSDFRWVLVQTQAACDYAQRNPGTLPYYLGIDVNVERLTGKKPPDAVWISPEFDLDGAVRQLRVSARYQISLTENEVGEQAPVFRLREQLLANLAHHIHSYSSRPGTISFH